MLDDADKQWILLIETRLNDKLERIETTLLHFTRSNELRIRAQQATITSIEERLDDLSDRVTKLEGNHGH